MDSNHERNYIFTSESVSEGHPDKMADQISDSVLDAVLCEDPTGRVACETLITTGLVFVAGEITTTANYDAREIARETIRGIGYDNSEYGFDCDTCSVVTSVGPQSGDISQGVKKGGAGDQGMMFGFACRESEELMPLPIMLAHKLVRKTSEVRRRGDLDYLRPDSKSQVSVRYEDGNPVAIDNVVISAQHSEDVGSEQIYEDIIREVIHPVLPKNMTTENTRFHVNPTGRFVTGGPMGDTGLTGRKIVVDTYGGYSRHGGGAFSGKDPSKVDRSAAYMGRYIAKNIVAAGLADKVEVQLAYAIGRACPVSVLVEDFGTGHVDSNVLSKAVREVFRLKPREIIEHLDLRRPIFKRTAAYGHFGRNDPGFTWEKTDQIADLKTAVGA